METVKSFLSPFGNVSASMQDTLVSHPTPSPLYATHAKSGAYFPKQKLVVIGGTVETARRASVSAWNGFVDCV